MVMVTMALTILILMVVNEEDGGSDYAVDGDCDGNGSDSDADDYE